MEHRPIYSFGKIAHGDIDALGRIFRSLENGLPPIESKPGVAHLSGHSDEVVRLARKLKSVRTNRAQTFVADLFGEPAWDMMLALFIAGCEGYRLKVSDLGEESGVPPTTALRWIDRLMDVGLARKIPNPLDARSNFIEATEKLMADLGRYLLEVYDKHLDARLPRRG